MSWNTHIPKFRRFVIQNFPFIEEDFDALTDYQLICKVVEYLNTVITSQNEVISELETFETNITNNFNSLQSSFDELQSFVDNYFENLDVQNEINNKLEDMAEDGTLQEIITAYIQSNVAWVFDTVDDMKNGTNLVDGSYARTLGYTSLDDKMGGLYKITTESSGNIPLNTSGLYAHHLKENAIVSIDDYDGATAEDRLYAALDDIASGTIIGGNITITKQYNAGAKDYRKIIITNSKFDMQYNHWFDQNGSTYHTVPAFSNCTIKGNGNTIFVSDYNAVGINFSNCVLENVCVYSSTTKYAQSPYFINTQMYAVGNLLTSYGAYDFKMIGCRVESATGKLIVITSDFGLRQGSINSCLIEGRESVVFEITSIYQLTIANCYFEACNGGILSQTLTNGSAFIIFKDNAIYEPMTDTDYVINITSVAFARAIIKDNMYNLPVGKYLCNKNISITNSLTFHNINYAHPESLINNGFVGFGVNGAYDEISYTGATANWNNDESVWECSFYLPYGEAYKIVSPYLLCFVGSMGNAQYRGYANILVTPRIGYVDNAVKILVDTKVLDACNTINETPTSSVSVVASVNNSLPNASKVKVTVKVTGFSSTEGRFHVMDLFQTMSINHQFLVG